MVDLYSLSVGSYKRVLKASINVLTAGQQHCQNSDDEQAVVSSALIEDMWTLDKQVNSVRHHSLGALQGLVAGEFAPPPGHPELDLDGLVAHLQSAKEAVEAYDEAAINALSDSTVIFRLGDMEIPFKAANFVYGFSLPNLYFHATTLYNLLRMRGVPLAKKDYLGYLDTGLR